MDNLKLPACPTIVQWCEGKIGQDHQNGNEISQTYGFTKLEKAALMIAQGYISFGHPIAIDGKKYSIQQASVMVAKAVLEEANK